MKKKFGFAGLGLMLSVAIAFGALASVATAKTNSPGPKGTGSLTVPADGTAVPVLGSNEVGGPTTGTFTIQRFVNDGTNLIAVGTFNGTINGVAKGPTPASVVVTDPPAPPCDVLHLTLGPLHLDL